MLREKNVAGVRLDLILTFSISLLQKSTRRVVVTPEHPFTALKKVVAF